MRKCFFARRFYTKRKMTGIVAEYLRRSWKDLKLEELKRVQVEVWKILIPSTTAICIPDMISFEVAVDCNEEEGCSKSLLYKVRKRDFDPSSQIIVRSITEA
ncbi:Hypothetical predicted protein [Octopus vulgaris]|uniref:Uncharacterized protein n=1 Tax=Octopus vulgaris TaxID=6645 RepID=A0AA36B354_OCTVU|nr:Hypothetical predicted protein [Octopus vulgaris]